MKKLLFSLKKHQYTFRLLALVSILILVIYFPFYSGLRPFVFSADQQLQYNYFYQEWISMVDFYLEKGVMPFYSFSNFLGNNFFASKAYYVVGDIFLPFLMLFEDVEFALMLETFILIIISALSMQYFLNKFEIKNQNIIIWVSLLYAFSGLAQMYVGQYMFHRFYAFFPLLLAGVELYRRNKSLAFFSFITCILFLSNYYFMFSATVFLPLYYIFSYAYHQENFKFKDCVLSATPLIFSYVVGFLLSAIISIPAFYFVLENERIGVVNDVSLFFNIKVYLGYFFSYLLYPFNVFTEIPNAFAINTSYGHLTWYSITTAIATIPLLFSLFTKLENKKIILLRRFMVTVLCALLIPVFNLVFHGFSMPSLRWVWIIVVVNALASALVLEYFQTMKSSIIKGSKIYLILFVLLIGLAFTLQLLNFNEYGIHVVALVLAACLLVFYVFLYRKNNLKFIMILSTIEIVVLYTFSLHVLNSNYYFYTPSLESRFIEYNQINDVDLFYRVYIDPNELMPTSDLNMNQSLSLGYNSVSTYDSMIESSSYNFVQLNNYPWHIVSFNNFDVNKMLGVKYYYVLEEKDLPQDEDFTYVYNVNHYSVYRDNNYRPIGFSYNQFMLEDEFDVNQEFDWNTTLLVPEDFYQKVSSVTEKPSINFELIEFYNENALYGSFINEEPTVLFFSIPYSEGWQVLDNNIEIEVYNVQGGFIGVYMEPGEHYLNLNFTPMGFTIGKYLSAVGIILWMLLLYYDYKIKIKKAK